VGGIGENFLEVQREQGTLLESLACGRPVGVDGDQQAPVDEARGTRLGGDGERLESARRLDPVFVLEEGDAAAQEGELVALGACSVEPEEPTSSVSLPRKISTASLSGVPRFHCLTTKG
jgi:hypothetical protein